MDEAEAGGDVLSPAMFLTKICMVSSASAEEARDETEETEETLLDRMMTSGGVGGEFESGRVDDEADGRK